MNSTRWILTNSSLLLLAIAAPASITGASTSGELKILPEDGVTDSLFGSSVCLFEDLAIVGAHLDDANSVIDSGAAYLFHAASGQQLHKLWASDGDNYDRFGFSVAISGDLAIVGARGDDDNGGNSGSVYIFDASTGQQISKLTAHDGDGGDRLGGSVSITDGLALAGAMFDEDNGLESGSAYVFGAVAPDPGVGFCFGDPGSGTPCPCNNDNDGSVPGSGCDNGVFSSGAKLVGSGLASISDDSLTLSTTHLEPHNAGLYFQANSQLNGGHGVTFGDGLRCAGYGLIRLEVRIADAAGTSGTTIPIGAQGGVAAGDTRRYQCWYRTPSSPPCGVGVNDFNLSNGYEITWLP